MVEPTGIEPVFVGDKPTEVTVTSTAPWPQDVKIKPHSISAMGNYFVTH